MTLFHFRAFDLKQGREVKGTVEAQTAQEAIDKLGMNSSLRVTQILLPGDIKPPSEGEGRGFLGGLGRRERWLIGTGTLIMILSLFRVGWFNSGGSVANRPSRGIRHKFQLKLSGRVLLPANIDASKIRGQIHLGEIPLDLFIAGRDLIVDKEGHFSVTTEIETSKAPTLLTFHVGLEGLSGELFDRPLLSQEHGVLSCDLKDLKLQAPLKATPPRLGNRAH